MKHVVYATLLLCTLGWASIAVAEPTPAAAPITVGSARGASFQELATKTARSTLFFIGGLLVVVGVIKKVKRKQDGAIDLISIQSRKAIGPRSALLIAEVEGKRYLLAQSADTVNFLTEIEPELPPTDSFDGYLERSAGNA